MKELVFFFFFRFFFFFFLGTKIKQAILQNYILDCTKSASALLLLLIVEQQRCHQLQAPVRVRGAVRTRGLPARAQEATLPGWDLHRVRCACPAPHTAPGVVSDTPGTGWKQHCLGAPAQPPRPPTSTGMLQRGCCHPAPPRATQRHGTARGAHATEGRETSQGQMRITKLSRVVGSSCTPAEGQGRRRSGVSCKMPQISRHQRQL